MVTDPAAVPVDGVRVVGIARQWLGTPYHHQASVKAVGCDCLGLVRGIWRELYGPERERVPAYASDWAEAGGVETLRDAARRHLQEIDPAAMACGDVLLFRWRAHVPAKHLGILATDTSFIHAYDGSAVVESPLAPWWRRRIAHVFRFPPGQLAR